ncbi:MAG: phosphoglycerate dehydrogenase [Paracoccaceae bacterium]|nr:phosphoglycerate dehydrogenase [Paracoccaceae bacterium]
MTGKPPKVLVSDKLSPSAVQVFRDRGIDVDFEPELGRDRETLIARIGAFDGLAVRSATRVTERVLDAAGRLKVIGRAGIGVDNIDVGAATRRGMIVMNTPFGNSITTAEHAISLMMAVARQIPAADSSTRAGKWEKSRFMGVELTNKTLGLVGCGNIGSIVADRALGLKMKVLAYDPFLSTERAEKLGVRKVEFDELLASADFISLHVPRTDRTAGLINADAIDRMKPGVRLINCARGGIVDESALAKAIEAGRVAGAAFDVFETEPATDSPLFTLPNVVCTPHLGAATVEAQENVALQIAGQMSDYLLEGAVSNAINMPSITAEEAQVIGPFIRLASHLGSFVGQMTHEPITSINILFDGDVARMNTDALTSALVAGMIKPQLPDANMVSAPVIARERGVQIATTTQDRSGVFGSYIRLTVTTVRRRRSIAGTVFSDGKPRFIQIKGINIESEVGRHMLYTTNQDVPGVIGTLGTTLGDAGVNIANFTLGRSDAGGEAIALLELDEPLGENVIRSLEQTGKFRQVRPLNFDVFS